MARGGAREALLEAGLALVTASGYSGAGLSQVVAMAGVPKGSFYHWFDSKESFVVEVARRYYDEHDRVLARWLASEGAALARLRGYFGEVRDSFADVLSAPLGESPIAGCLLGALAGDVSQAAPLVREDLAELFACWRARLCELLDQVVAERGVSVGVPTADLAAFVLQAWEGALMSMRVQGSVAPLDQFIAVIFGVVLTPRSSSGLT